ncbi:SDR family NAD(P)-dependent oxidoreductase [Rhodopila sp.]|uniref:SDR family NAD(P)-dependent oxidoreductase n=1 Tax=Rhodopila sp. TaxID=2480087 RepID=UPI003D0B514F
MLNIVVTGGTRGIGLAVCRMLAAEGYRVIPIGRSPMAETEMLGAQPEFPSLVTWDLSDIGSLGKLAATIRENFGPVYGLVNNAGIGTSGILSTMTDRDLARIVQLNVLSPLTLSKYLVRSMMAARAGRIVNMSSIVASTGYPGLTAYSATKAALEGMTRSLAREVGSLGITVNAVAPGFVETGLTSELNEKQREQIKRRSALQRMVTVNDVAAAVAFLISEKAANITGTVLTVDAGNTA